MLQENKQSAPEERFPITEADIRFMREAIRLADEGCSDVLAQVAIPQTDNGTWGTYKALTGITRVPLSAGKHVLRVTIDKPYVNLDKVVFTHTDEDPDCQQFTDLAQLAATAQPFAICGIADDKAFYGSGNQNLGYADYVTFCQWSAGDKEMQSDEVVGRHLYTEELTVGTRLVLTWYPDRRCVVQLLADGVFTIVEAVNTKLSAGDTFRCDLFIEGEPLYMSQLVHEGRPPMIYVVGKVNGIRFDYLAADDEPGDTDCSA